MTKFNKNPTIEPDMTLEMADRIIADAEKIEELENALTDCVHWFGIRHNIPSTPLKGEGDQKPPISLAMRVLGIYEGNTEDRIIADAEERKQDALIIAKSAEREMALLGRIKQLERELAWPRRFKQLTGIGKPSGDRREIENSLGEAKQALKESEGL